MTVGPWRPIYLHTYTARISDLRLSVNVSESLETHIGIALTSSSSLQGLASVIVKDPSGKVVRTEDKALKNGVGAIEFIGQKDEFDLWWPVGYGGQPIYVAEVTLKDEVRLTMLLNERSKIAYNVQKGAILDSKIQTFGIRRVRVIQEPLIDQEGRSFLFEINNVRIFCGGQF